jgi:murein DD-endopeptidase MepM/ murein hydrolase activator NlpD
LVALLGILVIFYWLNWAKISEKSRLAEPLFADSGQETLIEEAAGGEEGVLGGAIDCLSAADVSTVEASFDFTSDDSSEETGLVLLEGTGLVPPTGPGSSDPFSGFRREITTYKVQSGDTASGLAIKFGVNTDTILWANNLQDSDLIRPGQALLILPINGVRIKVGSKDTAESMAKRYQGKASEILAFNNIDFGQLPVGEYVIIPNGEMPAAAKTVTAPKYATATVSSGWLIMPTSGKNWGKLHNRYGVDISNVCGTPIYAAAAGKVTLVDGTGWNYGYGKYLMIKHPNGVTTLYAHASQLLVEVGQQVGQGQLIALMGTTGHSTGCHLHFEVRGAKNPFVWR